jgi:hypothetical protein
MPAPFNSICSYVREMMTRSYADAALLPVIEDNCPACFKVSFYRAVQRRQCHRFLQAPEERKRIKLLLAAQEQLFPDVHGNLLQVRAVHAAVFRPFATHLS